MKLEEMRKFLNFRELGGLKTADGHEVVRGQFYRSGVLADLNPEELEYVRSLGIKHVFDFRSDYEINDLPDPDIGAVYHKMNALVDKNGDQIKFDPENQPGVANLMQILSSLSDNRPMADIEAEFAGKGYGDLKRAVADKVCAELEMIQARYQKIIESDMIETVLKEGAEKARAMAQPKLAKVQRAIGMEIV